LATGERVELVVIEGHDAVCRGGAESCVGGLAERDAEVKVERRRGERRDGSSAKCDDGVRQNAVPLGAVRSGEDGDGVAERAVHTLDDAVAVGRVRRGDVGSDAQLAELREQGFDVRAVVTADGAREGDVLEYATEQCALLVRPGCKRWWCP
jgi:hypothetical protein